MKNTIWEMSLTVHILVTENSNIKKRLLVRNASESRDSDRKMKVSLRRRNRNIKEPFYWLRTRIEDGSSSGYIACTCGYIQGFR